MKWLGPGLIVGLLAIAGVATYVTHPAPRVDLPANEPEASLVCYGPMEQRSKEGCPPDLAPPPVPKAHPVPPRVAVQHRVKVKPPVMPAPKELPRVVPHGGH